jgi:hypothetical protein
MATPVPLNLVSDMMVDELFYGRKNSSNFQKAMMSSR